ncbi:hypothetical protein I3760_05G027700 [Carya illinoinensis]|nr:hypothetical protein I3760_05G027700 [Carya illinoinensis]
MPNHWFHFPSLFPLSFFLPAFSLPRASLFHFSPSTETKSLGFFTQNRFHQRRRVCISRIFTRASSPFQPQKHLRILWVGSDQIRGFRCFQSFLRLKPLH